MSTTNVSLSYQSNLAIKLADAPQNSVVSRDNEGDSDGTQAGGREGIAAAGGGLFQSVMQTLSHLGLNPTNQVNGAANTAEADGNGNTDGSASAMSQDVRQALHGFMYSLFQALAQMNSDRNESAQSGGATSPNAPVGLGQTASATVQSAYGNLPENLNALAKATETSNDGAVGALQDSFGKLASALGAQSAATPAKDASSASDSSGQTPQVSLQSFLKDLAEQLSNRNGSTASLFDATGSLLSQAV